MLTAWAARWATLPVDRCADSVNEPARELGCDWYTINDTVIAYGEAPLDADGDPHGKVTPCRQEKEAVRELYAHADPAMALEWVTELGHDLQDADYPMEARSLECTLTRWKKEIAA